MILNVLRRLVLVCVLVAGNMICHTAESNEQFGDVKSPVASGLEVMYKGDIATPRITYAIEQVRAACNEVSVGAAIHVSLQGSGGADKLKPEGFRLKRLNDHSLSIAGADQSGVLYGCLELAERIRKAGAMPTKLDVTDAPEFKLRGPCIGMQKLQRDPYGGNYQWPYTPRNFPFFYDKAHWGQYLDFLASIRMNSLYLWNGHPFASLVQLDDYPEALEVSPEILQKNRDMMYWLTSECDKRGIWLIQMFYNIHLPKGLGLGTSLHRSEPKAADYTRKSIAKFVEAYPNVGLLVCLGEALSGKEAQVEWFTETIIPGMKDGLKARGQTELPPIVVRGHHIVEYGSHKDVLSEGLKLYPNLFSMVKYNGESLTSETPRGKYQQFHKDMAKYSGAHMANVHCLSNLEPFRYADFSFIWNSCKAVRDRLDGNGLHLYPLAYWDWPNTPDRADITQVERDHLWFEIWARYCWKLDRDPAEEREHWIGRLTEICGTREAAQKIYAAYNASGECAPRILRRFGITGGNRQCMSLGMRLEQLTDPHKARVWQELYDSDSPPGETIKQYVENEHTHRPHVGETPPQIIHEVLAFSAEAVRQIEAAAPYVTENQEEFERLRNDMHCIEALSRSYCAKGEAAMNVIRYRKSRDKAYMTRAIPYLEESLRQYRKLEALTRDTYRYSNTLHGRQQVPWNRVYHWSQLLERYEQELADFKKKVADIDTSRPAQGWRANRANIKPWPGADFKLLTPGVETYKVKKGAKVFTDRNYVLNDIAPQLVGLTGMRFSHQKAKTGGIIKIDFETTEPVKVLVGYFQDESRSWLQVPMLEHVAHANERGGVDVLLEDVSEIGDAKLTLPKVNVHAFGYDAGRNTLEMIGKGSYVILGVIPAKALSAQDKLESLERIGIRPGQERAEFVLTQSGRPFFVKGFNYIRLRGGHATFEAATETTKGHYDPMKAEAMFRTLSEAGYNTVRVFVIGRSKYTPGIAGDYKTTKAVYEPYMENVLDFLRRATRHGMRVFPTFGDGGVPRNAYYRERLPEKGNNKNLLILTKDGIAARCEFITSFLSYIKDKEPALLPTLLGLQCQNEAYLHAVQRPFSQKEGKFTAANGKTYDLSSTEQRQALMDEGYRYYHERIVAAVKAIDPDMLVAEGVFVPRAVGKDPIKHAGVWPGKTRDERYPPTLTTIGTGALDFLDVHFYHVTPNPKDVPSQFRRNLGSTNFFTPQMAEIRKTTPVIMGEFGAFDDHEKTFAAAVDNLVQVRDLANKEKVNGMLFWTYDCQEQDRLYHATDDWPLFFRKMGSFDPAEDE